jgi:hypothetical protein
MSKFRKKPVVIEAVNWNGHTLGLTNKPVDLSQPAAPNVWLEMPAWLPKVSNVVTDEKSPAHPKPGEIWRDGESLWIGTLEGNMVCSPGDWIIRGIKGELYPIKADIFAATYEPAE